MNTISIPTTQHIELEYPVAGIGDRLLAGLIDVSIVSGYVIGWVYLLTQYVNEGGIREILAGELETLYLFALLPANGYSLLCEVFFDGQTLGKWVTNTRSISLDGTAPSLSAYLLRWLLRLVDVWLSLSVLMPGLVGLIVMGINRKGQRLGDLVAGTTVIKLKLVTTFVDTIYAETDENYQLHFPEISRLSDRDMSILKEVLDAGLRNKNPQLLARLSAKVQEVTGIRSDLPPQTFLETVLRDYNHYFGKR
jgi:uncharacterized RDD family membrane protein YckC